LVHRLQERIETHRDVDVVLAPSFLTLQPMSLQIDRRKFMLAAQNCYWQDEGAFTGEVSATMLRDLVHYVIVGHSERRHIFGETDDDIAKKVAAVIRNGMIPILCIGETDEERKLGETKQVLHDQLMVGLKNLTSTDVAEIVIAYEPVWAIGTGNFAKPDQVDEAVKTIRHNIHELYGAHANNSLRVLYGGSVQPDVALSYIQIEGVDGLLVGGVSLNYEQFSKIVALAHQDLDSSEENHG
jgi:triosephosphate isomerase